MFKVIFLFCILLAITTYFIAVDERNYQYYNHESRDEE